MKTLYFISYNHLFLENVQIELLKSAISQDRATIVSLRDDLELLESSIFEENDIVFYEEYTQGISLEEVAKKVARKQIVVHTNRPGDWNQKGYQVCTRPLNAEAYVHEVIAIANL